MNKPIEEVSDTIRLGTKVMLIASKCPTCRNEVKELLNSYHQGGGHSPLLSAAVNERSDSNEKYNS